MANSSSPPDPLQTLAAALESALRLTPCDDVAALRALVPSTSPDTAAKKGAGFVVNRRIRVGNHYDVTPAITIYDRDLGTLAFVEHIRRDAGKAEDDAWHAIERATAVRQILIDEAARVQAKPKTRVLPLQVELVLLVSGGVAPSEPDPVRKCLTRVARETGYLRLIGVSVLDLEQHPTPGDDVLRRAFAWLLRGTAAWFSGFGTAQAGAWRSGSAPVKLTLSDYRLAGTRIFSCRGNTWLNLVHGHNGSGKSSLAEAVELLLTTRIQRLDDAAESNYFRIVRHRPFGTTDTALAALGPCSVSLDADGGPITKVLIQSGQQPVRDGQSPQASLKTNSFRIDQVFMDKLIRSQAAGRAALFLDAFSPGDATALGKLQTLRGDVRALWGQLPEHVRRKAETEVAATRTGPAASMPLTEDEMATFAVRDFGALHPASPGPASAESPKPEFSPSALQGLLPVGQSELLRLAQIHPPIRESLKSLMAVSDAKGLPDALAQFESTLNTVRSSLPLYIADLATALRVFQEFRSWNVGHRDHVGDFEANLRRLLELQALVDLTARYGDVVTALDGALAAHWVPDERDEPLAAAGRAAGAAAVLSARRAELVTELAEVRQRVEASSESPDEAAAAASAPTRKWLQPTEVESLNRVDTFLQATRGSQPLGVRFNRALAAGRREDLADGTIGRSGGLDRAIEEALDMKHACDALQQASVPDATSADVNQSTAQLVAKARELQELSKDLPQNFFYRLARSNPHEQDALAAAFNELLALMTPARWAYRDIRLRAELPDGSPSLGLQTVEGAPADLLFNTAELNASALVLFLLLAPRLPNDLRLLVLDDPLQNMDELTVITLGRALAKLPAFYPKDWTVLAFFHGEENIQRIRDEAPCHVYHLPWLQTSAVGTPTPIEPAEADDAVMWQTLTPFVLADPPARAAG